MIPHNLKWIIVILIAVAIILYVKICICVPKINVPLSETVHTIGDFTDNITNGSLIFLSGTTHGEQAFKSISESPFSHVGLLFKEGDIPYILDCDIGQGMKEGVRVQDLRRKLARYKGDSIGAVRMLSSDSQLPSKDDMIDLIEKYKDRKFDNKMFTWVVANHNLLHRLFKVENRVFCSELVADSLKDLNILEDSKVSSGYSPGDFFNITKDSLVDGYSFDKPVWFNI